MKGKALMQRYMDGWKDGNESEILSVFADDCVVVESHGPVYCGKDVIKQWIAEWFGQGNRVEKWKMTSFHACGNILFCEWVFAYKGKKIREAFEGITIAKLKKGKITDLKEYRMTAFPYMWLPNAKEK